MANSRIAEAKTVDLADTADGQMPWLGSLGIPLGSSLNRNQKTALGLSGSFAVGLHTQEAPPVNVLEPPWNFFLRMKADLYVQPVFPPNRGGGGGGGGGRRRLKM